MSFSGLEDAGDELFVGLECFQGGLCSQLVTLFLAVAFSCLTIKPFEHYACDEDRCGAVLFLFVNEAELEVETAFLSPFNKFGLEVDFFVCDGIDIDKLSEDAVAHEEHTCVVASVEIDGAYECLEGVAAHVAVVGSIGAVGSYEAFEPHFLGEPVEGFALNDFAAGVGEESFSLAGEVVIEEVAGNGFEDGISEKFQPLVVLWLSFA